MTEDRIDLPGSHRPTPVGERVRAAPPDERVTVSVYMTPSDDAGEMTTRVDAIRALAQAHGLAVALEAPERRLVQLSGTVADLERAFGTELHVYEAGVVSFRARQGSLSIPAELAPHILAVLGLDTRPIATPKIVPHQGPIPPRGFLPTEVAALYGLGSLRAAGQCIGIVELGGGYTDKDNQTAFAAMGLPVPEIVAIGVDGAANTPGGDADGEVALDIQVAGGVAPGARLAVYFAPNTSQGFVDAITQATHDTANNPSVLSISWGSPEDGWSGQAIAAMQAAFADAAQLGVTVCAASGDSLATDGEADGSAHVDYPASDPLVLGCGGTRIDANGGMITNETVWNSNGGGTGGGVSALFAKPAYQAQAAVPAAATAQGGRGVPDVAGNADPDSGYRVVTAGQTGIVGGTSAVAPLWAAIFAGLNAASAARLGMPHDLLYRSVELFRDIVTGNNKVGTIGYDARQGWDACTGLGAPKAAVVGLSGVNFPASG